MWLLKDTFYFWFWTKMEYKELLNYGRKVTIRYKNTRLFQLLSCVQLFCNPMDCSPPGFSVHEISQARILECHFLLQGIFLTQELNPCLQHLLYYQADTLPLSQGKPKRTLKNTQRPRENIKGKINFEGKSHLLTLGFSSNFTEGVVSAPLDGGEFWWVSRARADLQSLSKQETNLWDTTELQLVELRCRYTVQKTVCIERDMGNCQGISD